jgi:hypothetical protein
MNVNLLIPAALEQQLRTLARISGDGRTIDLIAADALQPTLKPRQAELLTRNANSIFARLMAGGDDTLANAAGIAEGYLVAVNKLDLQTVLDGAGKATLAEAAQAQRAQTLAEQTSAPAEKANPA